MEFHGIDMKGKIVLERVDTVPVWASGDEGRIIYDKFTESLYHGTDEGWLYIASGDQTITLEGDVTGIGIGTIPTVVGNDTHTHDTRYFTESESDARYGRMIDGTAMIFYQTSPPVGWTKKTNWSHVSNIVLTNGNGGITDGSSSVENWNTDVSVNNHSNHTHGVNSHRHSTGSHRLTISEIPSHNHSEKAYWSDLPGGDHDWRVYSVVRSNNPWTPTEYTEYTKYTGGNGYHSHGNTGYSSGNSGWVSTSGAYTHTTKNCTYRPYRAYCVVAIKD